MQQTESHQVQKTEFCEPIMYKVTRLYMITTLYYLSKEPGDVGNFAEELLRYSHETGSLVSTWIAARGSRNRGFR